jgi:protein phosphatase
MTAAASQPESTQREAAAFGIRTPPVAVQSYGLTDLGKVRGSNEDHFLIAELTRTLWVHQTSLPQPHTQHGRNRGHIFLVADGMGGHHAGEVASALSIATIEAFVLHLLRRFSNLQATDEQSVLKDFQTALGQANARIFEEAVHHPEFKGMGTTLTLALASGWKLFVVHAGDSRCYLFRDGNLRQLTLDHTVTAELVRSGVIKPEHASCHQFRHVVTNVLGGSSEAVMHAELHQADLKPGDVVLLCSDGLTDMLSDDQISATLTAVADPRSACERLVAEANALGGRDNITAIVSRFEAV